MDEDFTKLLDRLKTIGYYIIKTDDGDRLLWEVFAKDELVCLATSQEEAYMKLGEFVGNDLSEKTQDD